MTDIHQATNRCHVTDKRPVTNRCHMTGRRRVIRTTPALNTTAGEVAVRITAVTTARRTTRMRITMTRCPITSLRCLSSHRSRSQSNASIPGYSLSTRPYLAGTVTRPQTATTLSTTNCPRTTAASPTVCAMTAGVTETHWPSMAMTTQRPTAAIPVGRRVSALTPEGALEVVHCQYHHRGRVVQGRVRVSRHHRIAVQGQVGSDNAVMCIGKGRIVHHQGHVQGE